jgi:hypothetical protein
MMTRSQTIAAAATAATAATATATTKDTNIVVYPTMFDRWAEPF